ncbi:MAG: hypothetical protein ACR2MA_09835 [Egibacteraceae bacterium]
MEPENATSIRLLLGSGFAHEGRLRSFFDFGSSRGDALVLSRVADDWGS